MTRRPPARPLYLDLPSGPVFAVYHAPSADAAAGDGRAAVPAVGLERRDVVPGAPGVGRAPRRRPAIRRCASTSRAPATAPACPPIAGRLAAWTEATAAAAAWLRDSTGGRRVAAIGMGLGGLVAVKAISEDASIDEFVAWATPGNGRAFVRAERAFAGLQASRYSLTGEPEPSLLPEGWMEVNGFTLSAETVADLEALTLAGLSTGGLQRALLLDHDGIPVDAGLRRHLEDAVVDVTTASGAGWGAMTFHPERFDPPLGVFAAVDAWLGGRAGRAQRHACRRPRRRWSGGTRRSSMSAGSASARPRSWWSTRSGPSSGSSPNRSTGRGRPLAAIFLNAGAVRRIGPEPAVGRGRAPRRGRGPADAARRPRGDRRLRRRREPLPRCRRVLPLRAGRLRQHVPRCARGPRLR